MRITIILILTIICSCRNSKNVSSTDKVGLFKIIKVGSLNNWHIIYATKNDTLFKIVSKKEKNVDSNCNKINGGQYYNLKIHSRKENPPEINGIKLSPVNYIDITCYSFDANTSICIEPKKGIYDLYFAENLKGLCLEK